MDLSFCILQCKTLSWYWIGETQRFRGRATCMLDMHVCSVGLELAFVVEATRGDKRSAPVRSLPQSPGVDAGVPGFGGRRAPMHIQ